LVDGAVTHRRRRRKRRFIEVDVELCVTPETVIFVIVVVAITAFNRCSIRV